jgi:XRE family transcriptional regulator, regulator of sulfur utilization
MPGDLDSFMEEVRAESRAEGLEAVAELQMFQEQYQLARQLFELRRARGWTQKQLAARSGVQQSELSRIERGEGNPTFRTLSALARALDVRLDFVDALVSEDAGARRLAVAAKRTRAKRSRADKSVPTKRQPASGARKSASSPRKSK